ncbi:TIGR02679 family protein [Burkholderia stagnalis]|uniref:TIGR02679 family protein n=1 Tax=Burkholderia stagnalis TaxID=1503054 RepID=UPI0009BE85A8|nr:TIGR02679 family protein [Burkholderia stagnalis]
MNDTEDIRLQNLLGGEALFRLRQRMRARYARLSLEQSPPSLKLTGLQPHEYEALALLSGKAVSNSQSITLDVVALDEALRSSGVAPSLRDALERLDGPILSALEHAESQARWIELQKTAGDSRVVEFLTSPSSLGLLKRLSKKDLEVARRLLQRACAVLSRLPASGMPRAQLAAEVLGDAHSLDNGQAVATLILSICRRRQKAVESDDDDSQFNTADANQPDESSREIWAQQGIFVNELARPALFMNVPVRAGRQQGHFGEPSYISLRSLVRNPPAWAVKDRVVYVCENPEVVTIAADRLGKACAPLICTDGMPAAAQRVLLDQLGSAGAQLMYHGDFDWAGLSIGNFVRRKWATSSWHFNAEDYELAASHRSEQDIRDLSGTPVLASWDPTLTETMSSHGLLIAEEAVVEILLQDLCRARQV